MPSSHVHSRFRTGKVCTSLSGWLAPLQFHSWRESASDLREKNSQMCTSVGMMGTIDLDLKPLDLIFLSAEKNHTERVIISLGKDQD